MKLLAIETSSTACSVALNIEGAITTFYENAPRQQTKLLLPAIDKLLEESAVSIREIDALVCGYGPGSFTGVRIAVSVAQGLAFGLEIPIILISSLAAAAQTAFDSYGHANWLVAIDARMGQVYCGAFKVNANGLAEAYNSEELINPEAIKAPDESVWHGAGNGWEVYENRLLFNPVASYPNVIPRAEAALKLAEDKFKNRDWVQAQYAMPQYLRDKVAEKSVARKG